MWSRGTSRRGVKQTNGPMQLNICGVVAEAIRPSRIQNCPTNLNPTNKCNVLLKGPLAERRDVRHRVGRTKGAGLVQVWFPEEIPVLVVETTLRQ